MNFMLIFSGGLYLIFSYYNHYLMVLLGIEMLLLSYFLFLCVSLMYTLGSFINFVFLLVLVCMGGFGISLLVTTSRGLGKDYWDL